MQKRGIVRLIFGLVVLCGVGGLPGCAPAAMPAAAPTATSQPTLAGTPTVVRSMGGRIVAEARVVPARSARLGLSAAGIVAEVMVAEGDRVAAGQTLLRLEAGRQMAAVALAEAQLQRAEANLAQLKAGPRAEEIAAAQAAVDAAQARLERVREGASPAEVAAAKAGVAEAQAALEKLLAGPDELLLIAAQAEFLNAAAALKQAQAAYDAVKGDPHIGMRAEALQLEQATNLYHAAQARLTQLKTGASAADIAAARARVERAQAQLELLIAGNAADVAAAAAEVRRAQAQLDLLKAGARSEALAMAEADVAAARAALAQARAALAETELRAPFAGVVAALNVQPGEQAMPGAVLVHLADLSEWQIETADLTETYVARVAEGAAVSIALDALPDLQMTGRVVRIRPLGENRQGDIVYTAVIRPDQSDSRLRWNMTASVIIEP